MHSDAASHHIPLRSISVLSVPIEFDTHWTLCTQAVRKQKGDGASSSSSLQQLQRGDEEDSSGDELTAKPRMVKKEDAVKALEEDIKLDQHDIDQMGYEDVIAGADCSDVGEWQGVGA